MLGLISRKYFTADCLLHKNTCKFIPYGDAVQLATILQVYILRTYQRKCLTADCLLHKNTCKFIPYGDAVQLATILQV